MKTWNLVVEFVLEVGRIWGEIPTWGCETVPRPWVVELFTRRSGRVVVGGRGIFVFPYFVKMNKYTPMMMGKRGW
jgi:hypothetical protein